MKDSGYTLVYAAVMGTVCALLLTGVGRFVQPYREANQKSEKVRNILRVLEVPVPEEVGARKLLEIYEQNVEKAQLGDLPLYRYVERSDRGGAVKAVAVGFEGQGLWGPVKGLLALEPDMKTIRGISFYEQQETPGLGGEIASPWFREQFVDKKIVGPEGEPGIRVVQGGGAEGPNAVDGITGATMTGQKVEKMLNATITEILENGTDVR
ncbi:MAG: FMN-binding protein [Planctomycetota bacterium]